MENQKIEQILRSHGIRKTLFRVELLKMFSESKRGLTYRDIKEKAQATGDKVTIYRALSNFEKHNIIHKVPAASQVSTYALFTELETENKEVHNHAHFICNTCENTFCMVDVEVPEIKEMKGYKIKTSKLTLEGVCPECVDD